MTHKPDLNYAAERLFAFKCQKEALSARLSDEEKLWELRTWDVSGHEENRPEPVSAYLHSAVSSKHADALDNVPHAVLYPREPQDEKAAELLSAILPAVFERAGFLQTWSDGWWSKLLHGSAFYGVFWNPDKAEIELKCVDLRRVFWEGGVRDLQQSSDLFIVDSQPRARLMQRYPGKKLCSDRRILEMPDDREMVVDWYRRTGEGLSFVRFCGADILFEGGPGWYAHGLYPIVPDTLFPVSDSPVGYGICAVCKSPQLYIDKLSQSLLENARIASRIRYFAKSTAGVSREQFLDLNAPVVEVEGGMDEGRLRPIETPQLSPVYLDVLRQKITELRETAAVNDFSQGRTSGGVTAASAIAALQEAGDKTSRDMISASYRAFCEITKQVIALIRQFYTEKRVFRVTGGYRGVLPELLAAEPGLDISVTAEKLDPFSRAAQNELALSLFEKGAFDPAREKEAEKLFKLMEFYKKEVI